MTFNYSRNRQELKRNSFKDTLLQHKKGREYSENTDSKKEKKAFKKEKKGKALCLSHDMSQKKKNLGDCLGEEKEGTCQWGWYRAFPF